MRGKQRSHLPPGTPVYMHHEQGRSEMGLQSQAWEGTNAGGLARIWLCWGKRVDLPLGAEGGKEANRSV